MESFSELIKARRSMRKFTEEELTQEQVVTLMKAALMEWEANMEKRMP